MNKGPVHILYCGNRFITHGIYLSALSVIKNTPNTDFVFHIMTMTAKDYGPKGEGIHPSDMPYFEEMITHFNPNNKAILYDLTEQYENGIGKTKNHINRFTPFAMLRLFAEDIIDADTVIYLDTDTMCNRDINEFFNYDISNVELGAVLDYLGQWWLGGTYFNSGVLFLNMKKIRETHLFNRCVELLLHKKLYFPDQDALNQLVEVKFELPTKFNDQRHIKEDTVISHYPRHVWRYWDPVRPWEIERMHKRYHIHHYDELYIYYLQHYPFELMGKEKPKISIDDLKKPCH